MDDYFARLEAQLAELTRRGTHLEPTPVLELPRRFRPLTAVALASSVAIAVLVAAGLLLTAKSRPPHPVHASHSASIPVAVRRLETQLAVLRRPQTAKDRSLPALIERATRLGRLGGFGNAYESRLAGADPEPHARGSRRCPTRVRCSWSMATRRTRSSEAGAAEASTRGGQGVAADRDHRPGRTFSPTAGGATASRIIGGEGGTPPGRSISRHAMAQTAARCRPSMTHRARTAAKRVVWQFPRQDSYGYVYKAPLTIDIPVVNNVAIVTNHARRVVRQANGRDAVRRQRAES